MLSLDQQARGAKRKTEALGFVPPMLPSLISEAPAGDDWMHEIKHDGYRTQLVLEPGRCRAFTRNGHDWSHLYRHVLNDAVDLGCQSAILDGEMIVQDEQGRSDFASFKAALHRTPERLVFYAFDLLHLNGRDLRKERLLDRRAQLFELVGQHDPEFRIQHSEHVIGGGPTLFDAAAAMGLEGIVSKRVSSRYVSGRTISWLKTKAVTEADYIVVGHERGVGRPTTALLARETDEGLEYVGGAMLTLPDAEREVFWAAMEQLGCERPPLRVSKRSGACWTKPVLRVRVRHLRREGMMRHGAVVGLRL
jgi:DNA ligase D-like protein (predicted ligase)